ncbi:hypothetical protein BKG80_00150 [Mycobacteroides chelonae]|uniref:hypothetical protein n=1 Tax=Mycobacteroides chelonae TaxID=1774 RepID=UPI0008AA0B77|nr:hypothetical protein [Mycobacteroides chelonae]MBF9352771.1 hypothetical protein [Mycobacteroides chelonae]OHU45317.1 hypothetical protein BKG80_00150 [Mycobacteroides chelonae]
MLRGVRPRLGEGNLAVEALECAALVWACVPARPSDRDSVSLLARCLFDDGTVHGYLDVCRALVPDNVERWLGQRAECETTGSVRRDRTILRTAGRVVHPQRYAPPRSRHGQVALQVRSVAAVNDGEVLRLYAVTRRVPEGLAQRMLIVLDLVTGAGARPAEIRDFRGTDVIDRGRGQIAVRLVNRFGASRVVPIVGELKAQRLQQLSILHGPDPFLTGSLRNRVNRVQEDLARAGFAEQLNVTALRSWWILKVAEAPVSLTMLHSLSDTKDFRRLLGAPADYRSEDLRAALERVQWQ